ncbi:hypothetical protein EMIT0373P_10882 [Pseudomonas chlororaphis]
MDLPTRVIVVDLSRASFAPTEANFPRQRPPSSCICRIAIPHQPDDTRAQALPTSLDVPVLTDSVTKTIRTSHRGTPP